MKVHLILVIAVALSSETPDLRGTNWVQVAGPESAESLECPIVLKFEETKYTYVNECTGAGQNFIVEYGHYLVASDSLSLEERYVVVGTGSIFGESASPVLLRVARIEDSMMRVQYGDLTIFLIKMR